MAGIVKDVAPYVHKVAYYETDKMGITHHSNYVRFMEEARIDYSEKINYSFYRMEQEGVISPTVSFHVELKRPTTFGDEIEIRVKFLTYTGVRYVFSYEMKNRKTGDVVAVCTSEHCFTDINGRPVIIKKKFPEMHEYFSQYIE